MKKTILITGSNGLLGQKLVDLLSKEAGVNLIATARGENRLPNRSGYTYQTLDITDLFGNILIFFLQGFPK